MHLQGQYVAHLSVSVIDTVVIFQNIKSTQGNSMCASLPLSLVD